MKRLAAVTTLALMLLAASLPAFGQATLVPADARFALVLNPSKVVQSRLGQTILDRVRQDEPNIDAIIDDLSNTVGIDLRKSLGQTVLYGTGYDKKSFALVADIGATSGNLNGLLLAAPGYTSEVYRESVIVHSLPEKQKMQGEQVLPGERIYCAMPQRPGTGSYYMVASFDPQRTREMVDLTMDADAKLTPADANGNMLIEAWFKGLPELAQAANAGGPPSVVAELVQSGHLALTESEDEETASAVLTLTMVDKVRSQQVFELMRGGLAMMQLAATAEPEAAPLAEIGRMINIQHAPDNADVTATFNCSYDRLVQLMHRLDGM